ncbi:MAG: SDR family oxidoreductase [Micavibrio sp.]|nr:SDR family oxidoreductase [Micavibrio sp.]
MKLDNKVILITGASRGIGKETVEAALKLNVKKIYAAARNIAQLPDFKDIRVVPVTLDITNAEQISAAAKLASDVDVLINNAGVLSAGSVLTSSTEALLEDLTVNYIGTLMVSRAFQPVLKANGGGAIVSVSSILGKASIAAMGGYCASKAALFSAIQSMRTELKSQGTAVFGVFPGPTETDMTKGLSMPKAKASDTAANILKGIEAGDEDIYPDETSAQLAQLWSSNPKQLEREFAKF